MRFSTSALATAAIVATANAANKGFNYGAFFLDQSPKHQVDFEYEFKAAKQLAGTGSQFTSARLYTMVQWQTTNTVIEAIQAAINTKTTLLLGLWASSGTTAFNNEIVALKAAIAKYGTSFTDLVVGISVGSEDLYRVSPTGIANKGGPGANPSELLKYIAQTRAAIKGTGLASKPIGHVDTWTAYVNGSNSGVISALDFIGVDAYPYWETTTANSIGNANASFYDAYKKTVAAAKGKPVWVTETGWPVTGDKQNQAVASPANARIYWEDVSCSLMKKNVHLYYYTLQDAQLGTPKPSFGIKPAGDLMAVKPLFDLTCPATDPSVISSASLSSSSIEIQTSTLASSNISEVPTTPLPATPPAPTSIPSGLPNPTESSVPNIPVGLTGPYGIPHLLVPIDWYNVDNIIGNRYIAQISSSHSTLFSFDLPFEYQGKTCNLVFYVPPESDEWWHPWHLSTPGGIMFSQLENPVTALTSSGNVGSSWPVGAVNSLESGGHLINSAPCEAGKTVGYRADALGSLDLQYFQMTYPASGLFMTVSG